MPDELFLIVPGTWARNEPWHKESGNFYKKLSYGAKLLKKRVQSFNWSGDHDHTSRIFAGKYLAQKIIRLTSRGTVVNLVTHSHGSNVGIVASHELALYNQRTGKQCKINNFYAFGTPVDMVRYAPDMDSINCFYHFFSIADYVQTFFGLYQRVYPPHARRANVRVTIKHRHPLHCKLHDATIARWIPYIHERFAQQKQGNFAQFDFLAPGLINFEINGQPPRYLIDKKRALLLEHDTLTIPHTLTEDWELMHAMLMHEEPQQVRSILGEKRWNQLQENAFEESGSSTPE